MTSDILNGRQLHGLNLHGLTLKGLSAVMPAATVVMMAIFAANAQAFLSRDNLIAVIAQNADLFVISVAFAMLLMAGYVDLSVGSAMAACGVAAGVTFNAVGVLPGLLVGLGVGLTIGLINGCLIGLLQISPIVVTLGMLAAARGVALALSPDSVFGFPSGVRKLGAGAFVGIPYIVWIALLAATIGITIMGLTPLGRRILAVGVNPRAAYLVGIPVKRMVFALYIAVGLAAGVGGIVMVAQLDSAPSGTLGIGFETTVLTAVLLGGIPFTGGRGSLWRVLLGAWFISALQNGLTLMNVGPQVADIASGTVLVVAAGLETLQLQLRKRL